MNAPRTRVQRRPVHGVLLLDKPLGRSSNDALQKAKWLLRAEKAAVQGSAQIKTGTDQLRAQMADRPRKGQYERAAEMQEGGCAERAVVWGVMRGLWCCVVGRSSSGTALAWETSTPSSGVCLSPQQGASSDSTPRPQGRGVFFWCAAHRLSDSRAHD